MSKQEALKTQILEFIRSHNGHIDGSDDRRGAAGIIRDAFPGVPPASVSRSLAELEQEGLVWSRWRHARAREHIYETATWPIVESPEETRDRLVDRALTSIQETVNGLAEEVFKSSADDAWVEEAARLEDEATRLRGLNIEQADILEDARSTIDQMAQTINRLNNDIRALKGQFNTYKTTVKEAGKNSTSVRRAERAMNEAIAAVQREHVNFSFSKHARHRMKEMGLEESDVIKIVSNPDVVHDSRHNDQSNLAYKKGELTVIVSRDDGTVITVLWNKIEQWTREEFLERNQ